MAVQFGVASTLLNTTYGVVRNVKLTRTAEVATYADADGDVAGHTTYDEAETISMEFTYDSSSTPPTVGTTITLSVNSANTKYVVTQVEDVASGTEYRTVAIEGKRWITNTIPA